MKTVSPLSAILGAGILLAGCAKPEAKFQYAAPDSPAPVQVAFQNQSQNADTYLWDFGDGNTSTEANPTHMFSKFGELMVVLRAMKGEQIDADTQKIIIQEPPRRKVAIDTEFGTMVVELLNTTPKHRDNFIKMAQEGFYNELLFHRVIKGFMIQGGDPDSRNAPQDKMLGGGGPGYQIDVEIGAPHFKGALAAARTPDQMNPQRLSSGSQFYIVQGSPLNDQQLDMLEQQKGIRFSAEQRSVYREKGGAPFLDGDYTVFGQVVEGLEVIDKIATVPTAQFVPDRPNKDVKMAVRLLQ
jgi:peptidyl-prolyl cis-trans isomerase B (cyclophilin B)